MHNNAQGTTRIHKHIGETPLEALERFRKKENIGTDIKLAYAGRLDPMAEGELLVLIGDECKNLKQHCAHNKEYEVDILFGMSTDSGDLLGIVDNHTDTIEYSPEALKSVLAGFVGEYVWEYPVFSSKTVNGKPLFMYYYENTLNEITIPTISGEIYELEFLRTSSITAPELLTHIQTKIALITQPHDESKALGRDFRRAEVLTHWETMLKGGGGAQEFQIATVRCVCSPGTYMRTLSRKVGERLGTQALAFAIKRTKILT